jgi:uncharacterized protein YjbJ (UPF0337 family)
VNARQIQFSKAIICIKLTAILLNGTAVATGRAQAAHQLDNTRRKKAMHGGNELVRERTDTVSKDTVKGTIDDVTGRVKRQVGEWTGDTDAQLEGLSQQVKGKAEKAWGHVKDAVQAENDKIQPQNDKTEHRKKARTESQKSA